jgi:hypothetical protein
MGLSVATARRGAARRGEVVYTRTLAELEPLLGRMR